MSVNTKIYDKRFFDNTLAFEAESARAFVQILIKYFSPKTVVDVGCGIGIYLAEFQKQGVDILGYDGAPAAIAGSLVDDKIIQYDLCRPLILRRKFDLCLCIEVAEHLEPECADTLVNTLAGLSSTVVFTAATPGQGPRSIGHINEQPPEYWIKKFERKNYILNKNLTEKIKQQMASAQVIWWLTKNLMIFQFCHCERPEEAKQSHVPGV